MTAAEDPPALRLLVRSAREFAAGGWLFTGFNWPLLAARLARRLYGDTFTQVFEAGAAVNVATRLLPTSTTDYAAYHGSSCYAGTSMDALFGLVPRLRAVLLDGSNVDLLGRVNSTAIGSFARPRARLPGGGGAADAAARASRLVLLHGDAELRRLTARVDVVTAAPRPGAEVVLISPSVVLALGPRPRLLEAFGPLSPGVVDRLDELGVARDDGGVAPAPSPAERRAAQAVLQEAADRGGHAAAAALGRRTAGAPEVQADGHQDP